MCCPASLIHLKVVGDNNGGSIDDTEENSSQQEDIVATAQVCRCATLVISLYICYIDMHLLFLFLGKNWDSHCAFWRKSAIRE